MALCNSPFLYRCLLGLCCGSLIFPFSACYVLIISFVLSMVSVPLMLSYFSLDFFFWFSDELTEEA